MVTTQRVFICSTQVDLSDERAGVIDAVARLQLQHQSMEFFGARPNQPLSTCIDQVRQSDIIVVIIGHMYGTIVPSLGVSYSEAEYDEGHRLGKPCLVYFRRDDVPILPKFVESDSEKQKLLGDFRVKIQTRHTIAYFRNERDLSVQVSADLGSLISKQTTNDVLSIVRQGRRFWNIWRMDNRDVNPDLASADLSGVDLSGFDLTNVNLNNANLRDADLSFSNFIGASLVKANLSNSILNNPLFNNADLRESIIDECVHKGRSFVDMLTLQKSALPTNFLRGCGVPDTIIDFLPSLMGAAVEFYSCFLAYSDRDSVFVNPSSCGSSERGSSLLVRTP
jgi:hypothetical protein